MLPHLTIIAVGKNKDRALDGLIGDYTARLPQGMSIVEITPPTCTDAERRAREAILIRAAIPARATIIALDERGDVVTSPAFAQKLHDLAVQRAAPLVFIIGGADGLDPSLVNDAVWSVALGRMTWPHMLVRLLLAEQLYRAHSILLGHPYHRV